MAEQSGLAAEILEAKARIDRLNFALSELHGFADAVLEFRGESWFARNQGLAGPDSIGVGLTPSDAVADLEGMVREMLQSHLLERSRLLQRVGEAMGWPELGVAPRLEPEDRGFVGDSLLKS